MADDGKKKFSIDMKINPYGEFKGEKAPDWFDARPKLTKLVTEIEVKRSMELDPRKWKQKDLEQGVYAMARYELKVFATALNSMQKTIDGVIPPKDQKKRKFSDTKGETKEETKALSDVEKKVSSLWKKVSQKISDKVSLALDDVEADKGDNQKSLAAGKAAIKQFESIDMGKLFAEPLDDVAEAFTHMTKAMRKGAQAEQVFPAGLKRVNAIVAAYEKNGKNAGKIAHMFVQQGKKITKDKNSDPELQAFGKLVEKGDVADRLDKLVSNVDAMSKDFDNLVTFLTKGQGDVAVVASRGSKFVKDHASKRGSARDAENAMVKLVKEFRKIEKKLK